MGGLRALRGGHLLLPGGRDGARQLPAPSASGTMAREITETEIDELFVELFGNTLGRNIKNVKRVLGKHGDWVLADQMTDTLKLRNELVHHWMRTRAMLQGTSENRLAMIDE